MTTAAVCERVSRVAHPTPTRMRTVLKKPPYCYSYFEGRHWHNDASQRWNAIDSRKRTRSSCNLWGGVITVRGKGAPPAVGFAALVD